MAPNTQQDPGPPSPFDPYLRQALEFIGQRENISAANLAMACGEEFQWLPGFCEVIVTALRTNRMIVINEWEPGKIRISKRGEHFIETHPKSVVISY